jgi:hypothetical protein
VVASGDQTPADAICRVTVSPTPISHQLEDRLLSPKTDGPPPPRSANDTWGNTTLVQALSSDCRVDGVTPSESMGKGPLTHSQRSPQG